MPTRDHRITTLVTLVRQTARLMIDELVQRTVARGYIMVSASWHVVFENLGPGGTRSTVLAERARMTYQAMSELVGVIEAHGYLRRAPVTPSLVAIVAWRSTKRTCLWHFWWSVERRLVGREHTTTEQIEIGAAEHLALEHPEPIDVPFDRP
jgi:hypothetical protein